LRILKEIGVKFPHPEVLKVFADHGAEVDFNNQVVKMPEQLVDATLRTIIQNTRDYYANYVTPVERNRYESIMILGNMKYVFDLDTYQRRKPTIADALKAIAVGSELSYDRISAYFTPEGFDGTGVDIIQHYLLFLYAKKRMFKNQMHSGAESAPCLIEMAKVVADNDIRLRNGTLVEFEMEPVRSLEFSENSLKAAVEFSRHKMKVLTTQWCWMGYHTPMTYPGAITVANTNILAGMIALTLLNPDNLFFDYIFATHSLKKGDNKLPLFGSPSQAIFAMAAKQMSDFYGFNYCLTTSAVSDSITNNYQAGFERGVIGAFAALSGVNSLGVKGIIGRDQGGCLEQLIIDDEMNSYLRFIFNQKMEVTDETIDFDSIREAGIGGNFATSPKTQERTKHHYWESDIFVTETYENWNKHLSSKKIKEKLNSLLQKSYPPKLAIEETKAKELDRILESYIADRQLLTNFRSALDQALQGK
jgi:trimethylamine--corrinoid protein Co-methyltransferase